MNAREALEKKKWAVVGDVTNIVKFAYDITQKLIEKNHIVYRVDPRGAEDPKVFKSLKDLPEKIDIVNLVIDPAIGINVVKEMKELGLKHVFIQPGASSPEIIDYCEGNGIEVIRGCVLAEYRRME